MEHLAREALDFIDTRTKYWRQLVPDHVQQSTRTVDEDDNDVILHNSPNVMRRRFIKQLQRVNKCKSLISLGFISMTSRRIVVADVRYGGVRLQLRHRLRDAAYH